MTKRPAGISILAFIYVLVGSVLLIQNLNTSIDLLTLVLSTVLLIGAIGLFMGQAWAWWIIGTLTTLAVIMSVITVTRGLLNYDLLLDTRQFWVRSGGRLLVQSLILTFLLSQPVIEFIRLNRFKSWQLLAMLLGAAATIILGLALWGRLAA